MATVIPPRELSVTTTENLQKCEARYMAHQSPPNGNHTLSANDQSLESDFSPWQAPDTEQQPIADKIRVDGEFYKRVGFYSAFNKSSDQEFRQAVARLSKAVKARIESLDKELTVDLERFQSRKEEADGSFRDECLNVNWFLSLEDAKEKIQAFKEDYNGFRPHSSLRGLTPDQVVQRHQQDPEFSTLGW